MGRIRFAFDAQVVGPKPTHGQGVGGIGEFEGEGEIGVDAENLPEAVSVIDEPRVGPWVMLVNMPHARLAIPLALIAVVGLAACDSGSSKNSGKPRATSTTRRKHRPITTTSSTTVSSSPTAAPVVSTTEARNAVTTPPSTGGTCGARAGAVFAALQSGELRSVPLEKYTISDCRIASSNQIWSAVSLVPNPGTGAPPLTVALERVGSLWQVRGYAPDHVACDAPPPVPQELRLGC
ncbi:MAG: hypothetical protein ABIP21_01535 [Acidimicrobiia bacterium]